jgi:hypothetical protein
MGFVQVVQYCWPTHTAALQVGHWGIEHLRIISQLAAGTALLHRGLQIKLATIAYNFYPVSS